jgi:hypothetical protein
MVWQEIFLGLLLGLRTVCSEALFIVLSAYPELGRDLALKKEASACIQVFQRNDY